MEGGEVTNSIQTKSTDGKALATLSFWRKKGADVWRIHISSYGLDGANSGDLGLPLSLHAFSLLGDICDRLSNDTIGGVIKLHDEDLTSKQPNWRIHLTKDETYGDGKIVWKLKLCVPFGKEYKTREFPLNVPRTGTPDADAAKKLAEIRSMIDYQLKMYDEEV